MATVRSGAVRRTLRYLVEARSTGVRGSGHSHGTKWGCLMGGSESREKLLALEGGGSCAMWITAVARNCKSEVRGKSIIRKEK